MTQEGFKRKLTAILNADVVGYSSLMDNNEEATVRTLTTYREVLATLIQQHNGNVLDSTGDNLLAEFASVVDAVQCAVDIQFKRRFMTAIPNYRKTAECNFVSASTSEMSFRKTAEFMVTVLTSLPGWRDWLSPAGFVSPELLTTRSGKS